MKQAQVIKPGLIQYVEVEDITSKKLENNEILLKIRTIGVCGSDIHVMHGQHPAVTYPVIQGHEYGAEVVAVGVSVTKVKPGDKATARPQLVCGECSPCKKGRYNVCQHLRVQGFQAPGVAQSHFIVTEDRIVKVDNELPFDKIAMIEPCAVGAHATSQVNLAGKNVLVSGAGTIGNLIAQFAKNRGAKNVLITDVSDYRLDIARQCGIDAVQNVSDPLHEEKINRFFGEEGFQVGFEVAGVQSSLDLLLKNSEKGSEIVIVGVYADNPRVNMYYLGEHELKLIGTLMYLHEDYLEAVKAITSNRILLSPLISKHIPFDNYIEAYHFIEKEKEKSMKVIIDVE
ncbi:MAG: alcohol dehydrogenase catalytic domain-containing protein [Candidatus Symbiothrix sp.]|jgi:L-iditol 2-dehydrogenase/threonine 3-dehydrogenase|nr:alcohol dehydrogenase catalytic domain-containing protein [Candidatus Symbiothrix sp.]